MASLSSKRASKVSKRSASLGDITSASHQPKKSKSSANGKSSSSKKNEKTKTIVEPSENNDDWTNEELTVLISNVKTVLPKIDNLRYNTSAKKLNWELVQFGNRNQKACSSKWEAITKKLRRYRTLTELVEDAEQWVKHPWSSHTNAKKKKQHPDMPKKPLTPYFRYFLEKRKKYGKMHPEMSMTDLAKVIAAKFKEMSAKKKAKYQEVYNQECVVYRENFEKFKLDHPEYAVAMVKDRKPRAGCVDKPQTPFQLFRADRLAKIGEVDSTTKAEAIEKIKKHWSILSETKRVKWIRKAIIDEGRYITELEEYCTNHPEYKAPVFKSSTTKYERDLKDRFDGKPDKPPNSGYSLYSKIMLKELYDIPNKDKMSEISKRWKSLSETEKKTYNKQAVELNSMYKQQYDIYLAGLSPTEREKVLVKPAKKKKEEPVSSDVKSIINYYQKNPSHPETPLYYYELEKLPQYELNHPALSKVELIKLIAGEYEALSHKKKEKYEKLAAENEPKSKDTTSKLKGGKLFKNEPKKPPQNAYSLFSAEMLRELTTIEPRKRMFEISKRWKELSPKLKQSYKERAAEMLTKYNKEYSKFLKGLSSNEYSEYETFKNKSKKGAEKKGKDDQSMKAENSSSSELDSSNGDESLSSSSSDDSDSSNDDKGSSSDDDSSSDDSDSDDNDGDSSQSGSDDSSDSDLSSSDSETEKK